METESPVLDEQPITEAPAPISETPAPIEQPFDPNALPPEHKSIWDRAEKTATEKYKDFDAFKTRASALDTLVKDPGFVEWYQNRGKSKAAPAPAKEEELSAEQFAAISSDPKALNLYLNQRLEKMFNDQIAPKIAEQAQTVDVLKRQSEIEIFAVQKKDFWDLDAKGLIEPIIKKYPKLGLDEVYKLAKYDTLQEEATKKAHGIVDKKKAASTEKPGVSSASTGQRVKVKNRQEAMEIAMKNARDGRPAPDFDIG